MGKIHLLDQSTINQIAAGEVVEKPSSVVKELIENSIDAGATAITVEVRQGGIELIRITDNGSGISADDLFLAFERHSTSKIKSASDLITVESLGFRGEALSSIAAVARVELITRTHTSLIGSRYVIEGGIELKKEEAGAPEGTTIIVRDLFFNTPARKKFLKTPATEGSYISDVISKIALSRPDISFRFIQNGQTKIHTSGNNNLKDVIYQIYGKDITKALINFSYKNDLFSIDGFIGKPIISKANRTFEIYFINGRYIKSNIISKAIEEAYRNSLMKHKFPFTVFNIKIDPEFTDVNVHPSKMEIRFKNQQFIYEELIKAIKRNLLSKDLSPDIESNNFSKKDKNTVSEYDQKKAYYDRKDTLEPFEIKRKNRILKEDKALFKEDKSDIKRQSPTAGINKQEIKQKSSAAGINKQEIKQESLAAGTNKQEIKQKSSAADLKEQEIKQRRLIKDLNKQEIEQRNLAADLRKQEKNFVENNSNIIKEDSLNIKKDVNIIEDNKDSFIKDQIVSNVKQQNLFEEKLLTVDTVSEINLVGQIFDTYWIAQYKDYFLIIDQHAAHEKINYESIISSLKERKYTTQQMNPPVIITIPLTLQSKYEESKNFLKDMGFEIEPFGGNDYAVYGMPDNLIGISPMDLLNEILLSDKKNHITPEAVYDKAASMACKAAIKGNQHISDAEAVKLIADLVKLENPYTCPHGRPLMIKMTKTELEKKFKRIL